MKQEHHTYVKIDSHPDGIEELFCRTCGRHILSTGVPDHQIEILDVGDEYALHWDGKGLIEIGALDKQQEHDEIPQVFRDWAKKYMN